MSSVSSVSPRTLADVVPGGLVRSIALVIGGAIFVGLTAQVSIPLPFTPVPLTLQTFSVLLVGAALGSVRGAASMALYLLAGMAGVPWFAQQGSGWAFASFGYIVGFVAAAWLVGRLAERGADRRVLPTIGMMALGMCQRKIRITMLTINNSSSRVWRSVSIDRSMRSARS